MAANDDIRIAVVDNEDDITKGFDCVANAFGRQTRDGFWIAMNPGWDTPEGRSGAAARLVDRFRAATRNRNGDPNIVFLKAAAPDGTIAGLAIWQQLSYVDGWGDEPVENLSDVMELDALYPGDEAEQRFLCQCDRFLHQRRIQVVREKKEQRLTPAVMVLDLCVVDPAFQRRGIAPRLVQWGLDEAKRRGGLEAVLEASTMGRPVYAKLGFQPDGEIEYRFDAEFEGRNLPPNTFMRKPTN